MTSVDELEITKLPRGEILIYGETSFSWFEMLLDSFLATCADEIVGGLLCYLFRFWLSNEYFFSFASNYDA